MRRPPWLRVPTDFEWWCGFALVLFLLGLASMWVGCGARAVRWGFGL